MNLLKVPEYPGLESSMHCKCVLSSRNAFTGVAFCSPVAALPSASMGNRPKSKMLPLCTAGRQLHKGNACSERAPHSFSYLPKSSFHPGGSC